jgi:hypothetical protein
MSRASVFFNTHRIPHQSANVALLVFAAIDLIVGKCAPVKFAKRLFGLGEAHLLAKPHFKIC